MIKLLSLFSGIGAFEKALENIEVDYELVNYCEIDKYASKSYSLIHNVSEEKNLKDVTKIDTSKLPHDIDLVTYGFPCQDISNAGKRKGFTDERGNRTRSGLFFDALRIIKDTKPKIAIAENVKALTSKKFTKEFDTVLKLLNDVGYNCYWKVLNSKNYGIPQNRDRVFIVSIRKDIDNFDFYFPQPKELKLRLNDLLESNVDEKYYLSEKLEIYALGNAVNKELKDMYKRENAYLNKDISYTINTNSIRRVGDTNYICDGIDKEIQVKDFLKIKEATKKGYSEAYAGDYVNIQFPNSKTRRGRVGKGIANTLLTSKENCVVVANPLRLRRLTEKECFRLMGFDDSDCDILRNNGISMTQIYKQAGNSIVVDVLEALFTELFKSIEIKQDHSEAITLKTPI